MTYTPEQLSAMSDREINIAIANIKFPNITQGYLDGNTVIIGNGIDCQSYDWVNDDALAFRLMVDNKVGISPMFSYSEDSGEHDDFSCWSALHQGRIIASNKEAGRLITEAYLLMQGGE